MKSPLAILDWTSAATKHQNLVSPLADDFLARRELGKTHAVYDFLFTYYNLSTSKLKQWIPAWDQPLVVSTETKEQYPWLNEYWFKEQCGTIILNQERVPPNTPAMAVFIAELCESILSRPPRFGCFGLHEWAMVYKLSAEDIRHKKHKLRLSAEDLNDFVASQTISCSHYDAYRFFTPEAKPLNVLNPVLETRLQMEQGGCVHANMDIYKWSIKLWPWIGSDFLAKAFFLALEGRELDMRASPYDLASIGFKPICIETEKGRKEYQEGQHKLYEKATELRKELMTFCLNFTDATRRYS